MKSQDTFQQTKKLETFIDMKSLTVSAIREKSWRKFQTARAEICKAVSKIVGNTKYAESIVLAVMRCLVDANCKKEREEKEESIPT